MKTKILIALLAGLCVSQAIYILRPHRPIPMEYNCPADKPWQNTDGSCSPPWKKT